MGGGGGGRGDLESDSVDNLPTSKKKEKGKIPPIPSHKRGEKTSGAVFKIGYRPRKRGGVKENPYTISYRGGGGKKRKSKKRNVTVQCEGRGKSTLEPLVLMRGKKGKKKKDDAED